MAAKLTKSVIADKLRKLFNTRDSEGLEKVLDELPDGAGGDDEKDTHVHIHMPGTAEATKQAGTTDEDDPNNPDNPVLAAIAKVASSVEVLGQRVSALESGKTADSGEKDPEEKKTTDADPDAADPNAPTMTGDSASLVAEFQDAKSRAEILAPGIKFPTFDAKANKKVSVDALCSFRRRALTVALAGEHEDLVKVVTGDADVSKLTCDSARAFFNAASELVKRKNAAVHVQHTTTNDKTNSSFLDINKRNKDFWNNH